MIFWIRNWVFQFCLNYSIKYFINVDIWLQIIENKFKNIKLVLIQYLLIKTFLESKYNRKYYFSRFVILY